MERMVARESAQRCKKMVMSDGCRDRGVCIHFWAKRMERNGGGEGSVGWGASTYSSRSLEFDDEGLVGVVSSTDMSLEDGGNADGWNA